MDLLRSVSIKDENKVPIEISKCILTVGPDYKDYRGGIGAILDIYRYIFLKFNFVPTYRSFKKNVFKIFFFIGNLFPLFDKLLTDKKIKIVHIHSSHGASFYRKFIVFYISKKLFQKKVLFHIHSSTFAEFYLNGGRYTKLMVEYLIANVDLVIFVSIYWQLEYSKILGALNTVVINNPVNKPANINSRNRYNQSGVINFLFLGKIGVEKGIFDLVDIIKNHKSEFDSKIKLFVGGDGEVEKFQQIVQESGLQNIIEYAGWVTGENKDSLFLTSDVFILPSYHEGMPVSILEAMSYGLPVLSTKTGGIPEIVENGINGLVYVPQDNAALKDAVCYFIEHPQKVDEFGAASLKKIEAFFPEAVSTQLGQLYQSILAGKL
jgi:glycosyltransferase involved in cell wall biosynthesis